MTAPTIHPEFEKSLKLGHLMPVTLPNGENFIIDGHQFYQATEDGVNMYQGRLMSFTDVIEKHNRLKLDETSLRAFFLSVQESATQAMLCVGTDPEAAVDFLSDISRLAQYGKQRLDLYEDVSSLQIGSNTGRIYELSSIYFFCSDEDPAAYDPVKGKRNVDLMLRKPELYDFFLRLRLNQFAPLTALSPENILKSIRALQESDFQGLLLFTQTLLKLRMNSAKPSSTQSLELLTATLQKYDSCYEALLTNLINTWPPTSDESNTTVSTPVA